MSWCLIIIALSGSVGAVVMLATFILKKEKPLTGKQNAIAVAGALIFIMSVFVPFARTIHVFDATVRVPIVSDDVCIITPNYMLTKGNQITMYPASYISEFKSGDIVAFRNPDAIYQYIPALVIQINDDEAIVTCNTTEQSVFTISTDDIEYVYVSNDDTERAFQIFF